MAQVERIRWLFHEEGWSKRKIAKALGIHRRTVDRWVDKSEIPRYTRRKPRPCPVLDPFKPQIEQWLADDLARPPKQRHTARRIFHRLQEECGYTGSEITVSRYVAEVRNRQKPVFIPLAFPAGESAQADFLEAVIEIGGMMVKVYLLAVRLLYSHMPFVIAFPHQRQEALLQGLQEGFTFLGGVPRRVIFDNLKAAVQKVLEGKARQEQDLFRGFRTHYLFESAFCNIGAPHEKGSVENLAGWVRRNILVGLPPVGSLQELNEHLKQRCLAYAARTMRGETEPVTVRWEHERVLLRPLPKAPFACCKTIFVRANRLSLVQFETNRYSVPVRYAHQPLTLRAYVERVEVYAGLQRIASHRRCYEREHDILELDHYLELLAQKPGAVAHAKPLIAAGLPPIYATFWASLQLFHARPEREFVAILFLHREFPTEQVAAALAEAHAAGTYCAEAVRARLVRSQASAPPRSVERWSEGGVLVAPPDVARYGVLSKGVAVH